MITHLVAIFICILFVFNHSHPQVNLQLSDLGDHDNVAGYQLVWYKEFNFLGNPNPDNWSYELGFVRNKELQWSRSDNTSCDGQVLRIEARREKVKNPNYEAGTNNRTTSKGFSGYTLASIITKRKQSWKYGRFEIRARLPIKKGSWPAILTLGVNNEWASNGEIDLMEFCIKNGMPGILANAAWGTQDRWEAQWDSSFKPLKQFIEEKNDSKWAEKFHIWRMDWDENNIKLYLDDQLLNDIELSKTNNPDGLNPFKQGHYLLLNIAIGENGGDRSGTQFPLTYEVDYFRGYQKLSPQE
ncbi:glycoside hydrolase family 16 protein [Sunxiuqinia indica]|nr:glycoside hydrolase family 16 protein [Sunxiuqinia indica]